MAIPEIRKNIIYILPYVDNSWKWIELAKKSGAFFSDAYRGNRYEERFEIISNILTQSEASILFPFLTDVNQIIDYMESGITYIEEKARGKRKRPGIASYSDAYTSGLFHSIKSKAEDILANRNIYEV